MKLCECGCGEPAPIASITSRKRGYVAGQPRRFVAGHQMRVPEARARLATYRARITADDRRRQAASLRAYYVANPKRGMPRDGDVRQARERIHELVRSRRLAHPSTLPCTDCGQVYQPGLARHEYDHHLGYAAEHHEDVEPVCTVCHHRRENRRRVVCRKWRPSDVDPDRRFMCRMEAGHDGPHRAMTPDGLAREWA